MERQKDVYLKEHQKAGGMHWRLPSPYFPGGPVPEVGGNYAGTSHGT